MGAEYKTTSDGHTVLFDLPGFNVKPYTIFKEMMNVLGPKVAYEAQILKKTMSNRKRNTQKAGGNRLPKFRQNSGDNSGSANRKQIRLIARY